MKAAFIVLTFVAATIPVIVPVAGADVLGLGDQTTLEPRGGTLAAIAILAWAMLGVRLIKA